MTTLLIAEHDNKILNEANKKAMDAATKIGEEVHILVAGKDCSAIAEEAAKIAGVSKVLLCDNPTYEKHMADEAKRLHDQGKTPLFELTRIMGM